MSWLINEHKCGFAFSLTLRKTFSSYLSTLKVFNIVLNVRDSTHAELL